MDSKLTLVLLGLLALSAFAPRPASGQVSLTAASLPDIGLGFAPSSVQPVYQGVPIYIRGDSMWFESYYNTSITVQLFSPGGPVTGTIYAEPGHIFELHSFGTSDLHGNWTLSVSTPFGGMSVPFEVAYPNPPLIPAYQGAKLSGNILNQTYLLPSTDAYDIEACSLGGPLSDVVSFALGGNSGAVDLSLTGNTSQIKATGITSPISLWLEFYTSYSYTLSGGGTASKDLLGASTSVLSISPPGSTNQVSLSQQMSPRSGRVDLRFFVRAASGLSVFDAPFLRTSNGTWAFLGGCSSRTAVNSQTFDVTTDLDSSNSSWPQRLLTMYYMDGQDSYTESPVPGSEAVIHLADSPDGKPLTGVTLTASGASLSSWDSFGSAVYMLTTGTAAKVTVDLSFSGVASLNVTVPVSGRYFSGSASVQAGTLAVSATINGKAIPNATISVGVVGAQPVQLKSGNDGKISILLPPGNYAVSSSSDGASSSQQVSVAAGEVTSVGLDFTQTSYPVLLYLLVAVGAIGVAANVYLWRLYLERRKLYG